MKVSEYQKTIGRLKPLIRCIAEISMKYPSNDMAWHDMTCLAKQNLKNVGKTGKTYLINPDGGLKL